MHADLSRLTFDPARRYSAVVAQQGRVQLDADLNEQTAIELTRSRLLAGDLIGPHGGPRGNTGFKIIYIGGSRDIDDLTIGPGRYYVDGIQLDSTRPVAGTPVPDPDGVGSTDEGAVAPADEYRGWTYWEQPDAFRDPEIPGDRLPSRFPFLVYLKVWERSVTATEDPSLREVALGSAMPDTAARVRTVWQVLPLELSRLDLGESTPKDVSRETVAAAFAKWARKEQAAASKAAFRAERPEHGDDDPCLVRPDARYRGPENQLYRVEVHDAGKAGEKGTATFKWSRENGSVTFAVEELDGTWVRLSSLGLDGKLGLDVGDRVEVLDTATQSRLESLPLLRVEELDLAQRRVRLSEEPLRGAGRHPEQAPFLRRWDHREGPRHGRHGAGIKLRQGALVVQEGRWLPLEDGVEVYFAEGGTYRTGDHWMVSARTATGDVEWPRDAGRRPLLQNPAGIAFHHAPLALVRGEGSSEDLRLAFGALAAGIPAASDAELAVEAQAHKEEVETEAARVGGPLSARSQTTEAAETAAGTGTGTGREAGRGDGEEETRHG